MTRDDAQRQVRPLAADRDNLRFTRHALTREPAAGKYPLTERQATVCLQRGFITENPVQDVKPANGWKVTIMRRDGDIETVVAAVLVPDSMILVITGYESRILRLKAHPPSW